MKGSDGLAIRKGMKLMKRRLRFKITAKLGNSKGQHCSQQKYIYIYIYIYVCVCVYKVGTTVQKKPQRKIKWKDIKGKKVFHSHMNRMNASYVQGAKC